MSKNRDSMGGSSFYKRYKGTVMSNAKVRYLCIKCKKLERIIEDKKLCQECSYALAEVEKIVEGE